MALLIVNNSYIEVKRIKALSFQHNKPAGNEGQERLNEVNTYFIFSVLAASDAALQNFNHDFTPVLDHAGGVV